MYLPHPPPRSSLPPDPRGVVDEFPFLISVGLATCDCAEYVLTATLKAVEFDNSIIVCWHSVAVLKVAPPSTTPAPSCPSSLSSLRLKLNHTQTQSNSDSLILKTHSRSDSIRLRLTLLWGPLGAIRPKRHRRGPVSAKVSERPRRGHRAAPQWVSGRPIRSS